MPVARWLMLWPTALNQDPNVMIEILCCYVGARKKIGPRYYRRLSSLQRIVKRLAYLRVAFSFQFEDVQTVLGGQGPYHGARRMVPAFVVAR